MLKAVVSRGQDKVFKTCTNDMSGGRGFALRRALGIRGNYVIMFISSAAVYSSLKVTLNINK